VFFVSAAGTLNVNVKKEISSPAQHCSFEEAIKGTKLILLVVVDNLTRNSYPNLEELISCPVKISLLIKSGHVLPVRFIF